MLTVATCFWRANSKTATESWGYEPHWVDRLYRGFARNLTQPFRFVAFTDREYEFREPVEQRRLSSDEPGWESMIEPFQLEGPLIVTGLDTIVTGNCDALADWCETARNVIALPRSPGKDYACNGVALVPRGMTRIHAEWRGENDMEWLRTFPHVFIEDAIGEGVVASFKCGVRSRGLGDTRIVYFHGRPKPNDALLLPWVRENWR